jgi:ketosteroid isomerase-like protein
MVICPQCNIEHEEGEEFCRKCGKFLLTVEEPLSEDQNAEVKFTCPRCQLSYAKGNYCKKCGSLLMRGTPPQEMDVQPLEKNLIKKRSKEWLRMSREEKELKTCMVKLETQQEKISNDVFHPVFIRYKNQLESLLPLHQEIETELKSIRKRTMEEIDFLEKELKPIQKRFEEFQSLYKTGAITKADFIREKKEMRKEIKSRERSLKKTRHILSLLPSKMGGSMTASGFRENLFRPFTATALIVMVILIGAGGYFLIQGYSHQVSSTNFKETPLPPLPSPPRAHTSAEAQEVEKIRSLFESIRMANLQKDIDLFMSCFSRDFKGRDGKRLDALKMWENYNYLNLSYELKNKSISGDTSYIQLEWLVKTSQKRNGKIQEDKTLLEVTLKREDGLWKIKEIKSIS